MAKKRGNLVGGWAFLVGVVIALIFGAGFVKDPTWSVILFVIGLLIGLLNVADEEVSPFLLSAAVLIIASQFGAVTFKDIASRGDILNGIIGILDALTTIFVPATVIVAIKNVFGLAKH